MPRKQVLTVADIPIGWSVASSPNVVRKLLPPCLTKVAPPAGATATATATFAYQNRFPFFRQTISYLPGGGAHTAYTKAVTALDACRKVHYQAADKVTGSITPTSFAGFGQESRAYTVNLTEGAQPYTLYLLIVRRNDELLALTFGGMDDTTSIVGLEQFAPIVEQRAAKSP